MRLAQMSLEGDWQLPELASSVTNHCLLVLPSSSPQVFSTR